jgi:hypothetical protein
MEASSTRVPSDLGAYGGQEEDAHSYNSFDGAAYTKKETAN